MLVTIDKLERNKLPAHVGFYKPSLEFNGDKDLWGWDGSFNIDREYFQVGELDSCGVCDTPEQFAIDFAEILEADPRPLVVMFSRVRKEPENAGRGGGWRWRKWGSYVGHGKPTTEYLDDEGEFADGIYTYHIYHVDNLKWRKE